MPERESQWPLETQPNLEEVMSIAGEKFRLHKNLPRSVANALILQEPVIKYISGGQDLSDEKDLAMDAYVDTLTRFQKIKETSQKEIILKSAALIVRESIEDMAGIARLHGKSHASKKIMQSISKKPADFISLIPFVPVEVMPSVVGQVRAKEHFEELLKRMS